jgi:hypothetical protein
LELRRFLRIRLQRQRSIPASYIYPSGRSVEKNGRFGGFEPDNSTG